MPETRGPPRPERLPPRRSARLLGLQPEVQAEEGWRLVQLPPLDDVFQLGWFPVVPRPVVPLLESDPSSATWADCVAQAREALPGLGLDGQAGLDCLGTE